MSPPRSLHDTELIVVGAGPVGLCLALAMARAGRRVLVLEKEPDTAEHSRAPAIWPPTQEILSELGVLERFLGEGVVLDRIRIHDADRDRELVTFPVHELEGETPFPHLLILPQSRTERLLAEAVRAHETARLLFSAEVVEVEQDGAAVRVMWRTAGGTSHTVQAPFVVGCDGARSTVRKRLGLAFEGHTYGMRAALADVEVRGSADLPFPRLSTADGFAVGIRMGATLWRLILPFGAGDERPPQERVARAAARLFPGVSSPDDYREVWQSEFRLHRRVADRFVEGRIALAGDAAHLNSPVGGQGMNAGIQDVPVLTRILLDALDAGDAGLLRGYERERRAAVVRGVNRFTDRLTRLLLLGRGRAVKPVFATARQVLRLRPVRRRFLRRMAMLDA